jgi:hypothetical protein
MEGTTSIHTILLVDVEVGSPPEKRYNNNRTIIESF